MHHVISIHGELQSALCPNPGFLISNLKLCQLNYMGRLTTLLLTHFQEMNWGIRPLKFKQLFTSLDIKVYYYYSYYLITHT